MIPALFKLTPADFSKTAAAIMLFTMQFTVFGQKLTFEKEMYDFGVVERNSKQEHFLKFKNTGDDTLVVIGFHGTNSDFDQAFILGDVGETLKYPPGKGGTIRYTFDTDHAIKYQGGITIHTNYSFDRFSVTRVRWEVPSKPIDKLFDSLTAGTSLGKHLEMVETERCFMKNCHESSFSFVMPGSEPAPVLVSNFCDSLRALALAEFNGVFDEEKRWDIMWNSELFHRRLLAFESFSRSGYNQDSLVLFFEAERRKLPDVIAKCRHNESRHLYKTMLDIVSPMTTIFPESQKIDLETYYYLRSLFYYYDPSELMGAISGVKWSTKLKAPPSFRFVRDMPAFKQIDLTYHPKEKRTFQLRGKIVVENLTKKPLIIAPYHDANTTFDQKSYRIQPKGRVEIDFRSDVDLDSAEKSVKRVVKMVNYQTKETQRFTIEASFIH